MRLHCQFWGLFMLCAAAQLVHCPYAHAQRIQLPTQIPQTDTTNPRWSAPSAPTTAWPPPAQYSAQPANPNLPLGYPNTGPATVTPPPFDPYATGSAIPQSSFPSGSFAPSPSAVTRTPPPFVSGGQPYSITPGTVPSGAVPFGAQPGFAAPQGFGAPQGAAPYYAPGAGGPDYLFPDGIPSVFPNGMPQYSNEWTRLLQRVRASAGWIYGGDSTRDLGVTEIETSATFDLPLFGLQDHFLITPGFGLNLWDGPVYTGPGSPDLPGQTYDAYLDTGWNPKISNWFSAELNVRVGVYTDFDTFSSDSFRVMGRGLGVVNLSPTLQFKLGVIYINRNDIKLLPAVGLIWDPSPDQHWEIFFPRPKIACRLSTVGNFNLWLYVAGEYGGGAWTIIREAGFRDSFDYNDIRALLGVEWIPETKAGLSGFFEVGYVFERELQYVSLSPPQYDLPETFILRGGFSF